MGDDQTKGKRTKLNYAKQRKKERADQADQLETTKVTIERTLEDQNIEGQLREKILDVLKSKKEQYKKNIE